MTELHLNWYGDGRWQKSDVIFRNEGMDATHNPELPPDRVYQATPISTISWIIWHTGIQR